MSQENVKLAGRVLDALARRDVSRLIDLTDPEVRWHSFFAEVTLGAGGGYRGHDGIRQYVSDLNDAWEIVRAEVDDGLAVGDIALLVGRIHYRGKASGVETASAAGWMFKFRDGRVLHFRAFREPAQVRLPRSALPRPPRRGMTRHAGGRVHSRQHQIALHTGSPSRGVSVGAGGQMTAGARRQSLVAHSVTRLCWHVWPDIDRLPQLQVPSRQRRSLGLSGAL
jgi:ketosteroid isomerase-like protein